ncbi:MAG: hypothetical protein JKY92_10090 [Magnetovibrio sp.]|nr:hypothetical protein [Magnetovibrio sp.]
MTNSTSLFYEQTEFIADASKGKRTVFYDEMSEYKYAFSQYNSDRACHLRIEIDKHINNLTYLSMYFDEIYIQTGTLFNISDPFIESVILGVINNEKFISMMHLGVVRICGWGGKTSFEMFGNALEFSHQSSGRRMDQNLAMGLEPLFMVANAERNNTVYRSESRPDDETSESFLNALNNTNIDKSGVDYKYIEEAVDSSKKLTGQLIGSSFNNALKGKILSKKAHRTVEECFVGSWHSLLNKTVPGVYTYNTKLSGGLLDHTININRQDVKSFLYSPKIFEFFLKQLLTPKECNDILKRPYEELHVLRNGDWARFCEAYHKSIEETCTGLSSTCLSTHLDEDNLGYNDWASNLLNGLENKQDNIDINAFIQALTSLVGGIYQIPLLSPIINSLGAVYGSRINDLFQNFQKENKSSISPYIKKIKMSFDLQPTMI